MAQGNSGNYELWKGGFVNISDFNRVDLYYLLCGLAKTELKKHKLFKLLLIL